jgi:hypothetical protein
MRNVDAILDSPPVGRTAFDNPRVGHGAIVHNARNVNDNVISIFNAVRTMHYTIRTPFF